MIFMVVLSIILYAIGIVIVYHNIPAFEKQHKVRFIVIGILVTLILTFLICSNVAGKITEYPKELVNTTKNVAILIFSPINLIILIPYLGNILSKSREDLIDDDQLKKRFIILAIILVILIIVERGYIKNFYLGSLLSIVTNM